MNRLMLAPNELIDDILAKFPLDEDIYFSPKIDGNRIAARMCNAITRSAKRAPNLYLHEWLGYDVFNGLDAELTVGEPNAEDVYIKTQVTRRIHERPVEGGDPWILNVFDLFDRPELTYEQRLYELREKFATTLRDIPNLRLVEQVKLHSSRMEEYEEEQLLRGYEGVMGRKVHSPYKYGRCTPKQSYIFKVKRFEHGECEVLDFNELMLNQNEAYIAENGYQKRSTAAEGLVPADTLGSLTVKEISTGCVFNLGSGLDEALRDEIWRNKDAWRGEIMRFKHFPKGRKDLPRFPVYAGTRDEDDIL